MEQQSTAANISKTDKISLEVNRNEYNLITKLRTQYRYGEVIIIMHDGFPQRLKKIETFDNLQGDLSQ